MHAMDACPQGISGARAEQSSSLQLPSVGLGRGSQTLILCCARCGPVGARERRTLPSPSGVQPGGSGGHTHETNDAPGAGDSNQHRS